MAISSVQSLDRVRLFVTSWTAAYQASLSITNSQSLFKLISIDLVMLSNNLILCRPLLLPPSISPNSQLFASGSQSTGASVSASVLPMTIQGWFPSGLTGLVWLGITPFNLEDRSGRQSDEVRHAACRWHPSPPSYPPPSGRFISRKLKCSLLFLCWATARVFPEAMRGFLERRTVWSLINFIQWLEQRFESIRFKTHISNASVPLTFCDTENKTFMK